MAHVKRGRAYLCGDCWYRVYPTEYEPYNPYGVMSHPCALCGDEMGGQHRTSWADVDETRAQDPERFLLTSG